MSLDIYGVAYLSKKLGLHYGKNRTKLVCFKIHKIFSVL